MRRPSSGGLHGVRLYALMPPMAPKHLSGAPTRERECPACKGTGFAIVKQPTRPGVRIYSERCNECAGKGRVAEP